MGKWIDRAARIAAVEWPAEPSNFPPTYRRKSDESDESPAGPADEFADLRAKLACGCPDCGAALEPGAARCPACAPHDPEAPAGGTATGPPCPRCQHPLDAFATCWTCRGRACQGCGTWMERPYARECATCIAPRCQSRRMEAWPPEALARLHPCGACAKLIPLAWNCCAVCERFPELSRDERFPRVDP